MHDVQGLLARIILFLRSGAFFMVFVLSTVVYALLSVLIYPLPFPGRYPLLTSWADLNIWWLKVVCKLDYCVEGLENIPKQASIVMSNHQSAWETLALKKFFPPLTWVVKRELLWIPFFGWGLSLIDPIALNRRSGHRALEQLLDQGRKRLLAGRWIIVFPQGTRVAPGTKRRFKLGGAMIASRTQVPVVPVAHNAGNFWPRRRFIKYPGTITVRIGPPIDSRGKQPDAINAEAQAWIEATLNQLP
jgi:1-acyl-sn-glycerol-3-phosphate acyltransferase